MNKEEAAKKIEQIRESFMQYADELTNKKGNEIIESTPGIIGNVLPEGLPGL